MQGVPVRQMAQGTPFRCLPWPTPPVKIFAAMLLQKSGVTQMISGDPPILDRLLRSAALGTVPRPLPHLLQSANPAG